MTSQGISPDFPFASKYLDVLGSKMHYVDEGTGDPILFLHGNPTSSYLWRNIIPYMTDFGRCIAPDLIGMGKSDKPSLAYRFFDHVTYLDGFINGLGLKNVTLVIHDWGSGLGFHYAARYPENVKAIAFMEAIVRPVNWSDFPKDFKTGFKMMRTPVLGWSMLTLANGFLKQVMPKATIREYTPEELAAYKAPFRTMSSRRPIRQWPLEIPINGSPVDMYEVISGYNRWLQTSDHPKLLLHAKPGGIITPALVKWCEDNLKNLTSVFVGKGVHYIQEDQPHRIGEELASWYENVEHPVASPATSAPEIDGVSSTPDEPTASVE